MFRFLLALVILTATFSFAAPAQSEAAGPFLVGSRIRANRAEARLNNALADQVRLNNALVARQVRGNRVLLVDPRFRTSNVFFAPRVRSTVIVDPFFGSGFVDPRFSGSQVFLRGGCAF